MKEQALGDADASSAVKGQRKVDYALDGVHQATIYDGTKLNAGMQFDGPAIIEDPGTTIVIHPENKVDIDGYGNICIQLPIQQPTDLPA